MPEYRVEVTYSQMVKAENEEEAKAAIVAALEDALFTMHGEMKSFTAIEDTFSFFLQPVD